MWGPDNQTAANLLTAPVADQFGRALQALELPAVLVRYPANLESFASLKAGDREFTHVTCQVGDLVLGEAI